MTPEGESQEDALEQTSPLVHPHCTMKIGYLNARTLSRSGNIAQVLREMAKRDIDIMGISETHWIGQGEIQLAEGETIIYSGNIMQHRSSECTDRLDNSQRKGNPCKVLLQTYQINDCAYICTNGGCI